MTTINSYSKPKARGPGGSEKRRQGPGFPAGLSALGALGAAVLLAACAGELDTNPNNFEKAFAAGGTTNTTGGTTGAGGSATTGGSMGTTGGTAPGTGGSATGGGSAVPMDDSCVATVFTAKLCSNVCHTTANVSSPTIGAGLALDGPNLGARLSTTRTTAASCSPGLLIIDPDVPANSILLKKVSAKHTCGTSMPQDGVGLTGTDLACITDWINKF